MYIYLGVPGTVPEDLHGRVSGETDTDVIVALALARRYTAVRTV